MLIFVLIAGVAILLAILAFLRQRLLLELSSMSLLIFHTHRVGVVFYSLLILPGTIIHELSHFVVATFLRVPTGKLSILPDPTMPGGEQNLGSLQTAKTDPIRASLIGLAPLISGMIILVILSLLIRDWWQVRPVWQLVALIYAVVVTSNSMFTSPSDRASLVPATIILTIFSVILYVLGVRLPDSFFRLLISSLEVLIWVLMMTVGLNLGTIALSSLIRAIIEKFSHKKIIMHKGGRI